jgi:tight adherence protein B
VTQLLAYLGIGLTGVGGGATLWLVLRDPDSAPRGALARYIADLDVSARFLLLSRNGTQIARIQMVAFALAIAAAVTMNPVFLYIGVLSLIGPPLWLRRKVRKRREKLEEQVDGWLLMLANMLKATGALTDAIRATVPLTAAPMSEEVDLVAKEIKLGAPLNQALEAMGRRIRSPIISAAITSLLVGRRTGGDMPRLLEQSAASLREIARLEGVVRAKTAQSRMQLWVMAGIPPLIYWGLTTVDPHFFDPLVGLVGTIVYGVGFALWLGGLVLAWKILNVDV